MNRFILADSTKCIGCRTCEVACVVSHQQDQDCAAISPQTLQRTDSRGKNRLFFHGGHLPSL